MSNKWDAFWKGGCGCMVIFFVLGGIALVLGGRVHLDFGGVILLFIIGGALGLIASWFYNKGKDDGNKGN